MDFSKSEVVSYRVLIYFGNEEIDAFDTYDFSELSKRIQMATSIHEHEVIDVRIRQERLSE